MYVQGQASEEEEEDDDDEEEEDAIGEMKAKFDKIMATFVDDQNRGGVQLNRALLTGQAQTPSSKMPPVKESITEFKNKNLQNNMKELIRGTDESEEEDEVHEEESPAILEGVEQTDQTLNIKIN